MKLVPGGIYSFVMLTKVFCLVVNNNKYTMCFPFNSFNSDLLRDGLYVSFS